MKTLNLKLIRKFPVLLLLTAIPVFTFSIAFFSERHSALPCTAVTTFTSGRELPDKSGGGEGYLKTEANGLLPASVISLRKDRSGRPFRIRTESAEPAEFNRLLLPVVYTAPEKSSLEKILLFWISNSIPIRAGPYRG